ncbi:hypothetical protein E2P81_ATG11158 [Venturia nashicola]|nr:hypothetical protein E2P81_ATG11158 [Venturia nashicola]
MYRLHIPVAKDIHMNPHGPNDPRLGTSSSCSSKNYINHSRSAGIHASIYKIPKLPEMIGIHCQGAEHTSSQFSS